MCVSRPRVSVFPCPHEGDDGMRPVPCRPTIVCISMRGRIDLGPATNDLCECIVSSCTSSGSCMARAC